VPAPGGGVYVALNAKEFALLAGISYARRLERFRVAVSQNFRGLVFREDFADCAGLRLIARALAVVGVKP
jgi:hypothetical protein